ncbi:hypothetical protein Salat_0689000 [Sesamum alatum]|uniref:Uncharacterized protein n=1 Tax=Sesamum alatum TaxID=300844 RepID=A0AAE2CUR2_9LAMI|nr:hypothetical protein Salat_0689000 [Sesamum alatum]
MWARFETNWGRWFPLRSRFTIAVDLTLFLSAYLRGWISHELRSLPTFRPRGTWMEQNKTNNTVRILVVLEVSATGGPGTESLPPSFPPDSLVIRMLVLRISDCPSPTFTAQPENRGLMHSIRGMQIFGDFSEHINGKVIEITPGIPAKDSESVNGKTA